MAEELRIAATADVRGLSCPMPVVKAKKAIGQVQPGEVIEILASDRGSVKDIPAWCQAAGHTLIRMDESDGVFRYLVRRGA